MKKRMHACTLVSIHNTDITPSRAQDKCALAFICMVMLIATAIKLNVKTAWPMVTYTITDHLVLYPPTCTCKWYIISAVKKGIQVHYFVAGS